MVEEAIRRGFDSIGFSSHECTLFPFDECGIDTMDEVESYITELEKLQEEYGDRIRIFKGLEVESRHLDTLTPSINPRLDYSIGSIHWFWVNGKDYSVDYIPQVFKDAEKEAGGLRPLLEGYYEEVKRFASFSSYSITGHIDLVTKFVEKEKWDFEKEKWYRDAANAAVEYVVKKGKLLEVNTGAISRGYRTTPYPSPFILSRMKELNAPVVLTSDCHDATRLEEHFKESKELLSSLGFKELYYLTDNGFQGEKLI